MSDGLAGGWVAESEDGEIVSGGFDGTYVAGNAQGGGELLREMGRAPVGSVRWNGPALDAVLQSAVFTPGMTNVLDKLRDAANGMAVTERAEYRSAVHPAGNSHGFAPGGYIYTGNYAARVDEAYHATLLKIIGQAQGIVSSGPLPSTQRWAPTRAGLRIKNADGRWGGRA